MQGVIIKNCTTSIPALGMDVCAAFEKQPKGLIFTKPDFRVPSGTEDVGAYIKEYALPYYFEVSEGKVIELGLDVPPAVFPLLEGLTNLEPTGGDVRISQEGFGSGVVNGHENYQEVYTFLRGGMCLFKQLSKMEGQDPRVFFVDESDVAYGVMGKDGSIRGFLANIGVNYRKNVGTTPAAIMVTLVYATSYTEDFKNVTSFDIPEDLRGVRQVELNVESYFLEWKDEIVNFVRFVTSCSGVDVTDYIHLNADEWAKRITTYALVRNGDEGAVGSVVYLPKGVIYENSVYLDRPAYVIRDVTGGSAPDTSVRVNEMMTSDSTPFTEARIRFAERATVSDVITLPFIPVTGLTSPEFFVAQTSGEFNWGETLQIAPFNATDKRINYSMESYSGYGNIDVDSNGVISFNGAAFGIARIKAETEDGGFTAYITVTNAPDANGFEIDVATEGGFKMSFSGTSVYLDATQLTSNVAVPNVVGKHVLVYLGESVSTFNLKGNRLQGDLVIPVLTFTGGSSTGTNLDLSSNQLTSVSLPVLTSTSGGIILSNNQLTSVSLPVLTTTGGGIILSNNQLTSVSLPVLTSVGGDLILSSNQLTSVSLPMLTSTSGGLNLSNNQLTSVSLPVLTSVGGDLTLSSNQLTSVSLPMLTSTSGGLTLSSNQLTSVSLPVLTTTGGGGLDLSSNQLTSVTVEGIFQTLIGFTVVRKAYVSGGTNAPYSTWSQQAKDDFTTLQNAGWTITYNQ